MPVQFQSLCPLLEVFDMPASLAFYRDALGMTIIEAAPPPNKVTDDEFGWVWLQRDSTSLMLNSMYEMPADRPPSADPARVAAHRDTTLYFGCPDVDGMYVHLRAKGITPEPPQVASYGMKQLYLTDPDGFNVCFQWSEDKE